MCNHKFIWLSKLVTTVLNETFQRTAFCISHVKPLEMLLIYERLHFLVAKFVLKCPFLWRKIIFKRWSRWFCVSCGVDSFWCALQSWSNTFWCSYHKAGQDLSVDLSTSSPVCLVTWALKCSSRENGSFQWSYSGRVGKMGLQGVPGMVLVWSLGTTDG